MSSVSANLPVVVSPPLMSPQLSAGRGTPRAMAMEFESLLIGDLLKTMRTSSLSEEGGLFPGDQSDTYGGIFDMYFGKFLAEHGGLGLADTLEKSLAKPVDSSSAINPAAREGTV
jgi:Rod binding domain-containing protein